MKLNTKGQVTIPADLRHRYGFAPGDEVEVIEDSGTLRIVRKEPLTAGERAVQRVRGISAGGISTDEILAMTRG